MNTEIVNKLVEIINNLPTGKEISVNELLKEQSIELEEREKFEIYKLVIEKCKEQNIELDFSKYAGKSVGLPHNTTFIKK